MKQRPFGCFTIGLFIFSTVFLVAAIYLTIKNLKTWKAANRTIGLVIENTVEAGDEGDMYRPRIEFVNAQGTTIVFPVGFASSFQYFEVGEKVEVLYLPDGAITNTFSERWAGLSLLTTMGVIGLLLAVLIIRYSTREQRRIDNLLKNGSRVIATINHVNHFPGSDETYSAVSFSCEAEIGGIKHTFISGSIRTEKLTREVGSKLTVCYEHRNPANYFVVLPDGI
jgi:hypothetical protein